MILLIIYWAILFFVVFTYIKPNKSTRHSTETSKIQVVIPIKNEEKHFGKIKTNIALFNKFNIQVTLIDDHSERPFDKEFEQHKCDIFPAPKSGKYNAILAYAEQSSSEFLWIVDADIEVNEKGIKKMLNATSREVDMVFLSVVHAEPNKFWQYFVWMEQILLQRAAWLGMQINQPAISNAAFTIVNREKYVSVFRDQEISAGGDVLLTKKLNTKRQKMIAPKTSVTTDFLPTFRSIVSQRRRWMSNQKHMRFRAGTVISYILWLFLIFALPIALIGFLQTEQAIYWAIGFPVLIVLGVFSNPFFTAKSFLSIMIYALFGWMYQCIQFILIIFGRS